MWTRQVVAIAMIAAGIAACLPAPVAASYPRPALKAPACLVDVESGTPPYGQGIYEVTVGDWNGDGRTDLVVPLVSYFQSSTPTYHATFLNNEMVTGGPQIFRQVPPPAGFDPGPALLGIVTGDFNSDGRPDFATIDLNSPDVRVQLTTTGSALGAATSYPITGATDIIRAYSVDMDHDGLLDLAVLAYTNVTFHHLAAVLRNVGGGSFLLITPILDLGPGLHAMTLGDTNGDNRPDLVVLDWSLSLCQIYETTDPIGFAPPYTVTTGRAMDAVVVNADGNAMPDLALLWGTTTSISIHHGTAGGVIPTVHDDILLDRQFPEYLEGGDLDNDGVSELVVTHSYIPTPSDDWTSGTLEIVDLSTPFAPHTLLSPGRSPGRPVIASLDLDGLPDLVVPLRGQDAHNVAVMLGPLTAEKGIERLLSGSYFSFMGTPAVADFNRDGKPDIAAPVGTTTTVHLGDGSGGFSSGANTSAADWDRLFSCDLNRDGKPDLLHSAPGPLGWRLQLGNGDGTFGAESPLALPSGASIARHPVVDMNRDGIDDVIYFLPDDLFVAMGNGTGAFPIASFHARAPLSRDAVAVDLDLDGDLDLAVATQVDGIRLYLGDGVSALTPAGTIEGFARYETITAGDLNRDGKPDLVAHRYYAGSYARPDSGLVVYYTDGLGNVTGQLSLGAPERKGVMLETWDVNRDGLPDIVCTAKDDLHGAIVPATTSVYLQTSPDVFSPRLDYAQGHVPVNEFAAVADADGDLQRDVVGFNLDFPGPVLTVVQGNSYSGPWGVSGQQDFGTGAYPNGIATGDMNSDGALDLVTADTSGDAISVLLGDGNGSFGANQTQTLTAPIKVALADMNRDGRLDVVALHSGAGGPLAVMLGNGDGTLGAPTLYAFPVTIPRSLEIADFNRDGIPDVAAYGSGTASIQVYLGSTGGGLTFEGTVTAPITVVKTFSIGDMNRDGRDDILILIRRPTGPEVLYAAGNGDGSFQTPVLVWAGAGADDQPCAMTVGDVNRDGAPDVVVTLNDFSSYPAVLLYGNGAGGLGSEVAYPAGAIANYIALGYLDGDKWIDLATSSSTEGLLSVRLGDGAGGFGTRVDVGRGTISEGLVIADLDRDGMNDIAFSNSDQATASVLLNNKSNITGVGEAVSDAPRVVGALAQNAPNPFNPRTTIRFTLPSTGRAKLVVYDVNGRRVATLVDRPLPAGEHRVAWAGRDDVGRAVASGIYFYRIEAGTFSAARRMTLLK